MALGVLLVVSLPVAGVVSVGGGTSAGVREGPAIRFAPQEGLVLEKTFTRELDLTLERACVGSDLASGLEEPGRVSEAATWFDRQEVRLTDVYGAVGDGRPLRVRRTFERVRMEHERSLAITSFGYWPIEVHTPSEGRGVLEGESVLFTWDAQREVYDCTPVAADRGLPSAVLAGLEEDADLRSLLPWEGKGFGNPWFTDVHAFRQLCWPGGAMPFLDELGDVVAKPVDQLVLRDLDGTVRVEAVDVRTVAGRSVARLALRCVLEAEAEFDHDLFLSSSYFVETWPFDVRQHLDLYLVATGTADWDLEGGHLLASSLSGRVEVGQLASANLAEERRFGSLELHLRARWRGEFRAAVEVVRAGVVEGE